MATQSRPSGFNTVNAHLIVRDAPRAIEFYQRAFGASEKFRLKDPDGAIAHAELVIGDSVVMLGEESERSGALGPQALSGSPVLLHLYVDDADATAATAVELGAEVLIPVADQFYGDRSGRLRDPFGHIWVVATSLEEVAPEEMQRRFDELFSG